MTTLSGQTRFQKMKRVGQPYTIVRPDRRYEEVEIEIEGEKKKGLTFTDGYAVIGHTYEEQATGKDDEDGNPVFELGWMEHDLGQQPTLEEAHSAAADWRESLRGQYPLR